MIESTDLALPPYEDIQHLLFKQILDAVKLASAAALVLSLGALFLPAARIASLTLLAGLVTIESEMGANLGFIRTHATIQDALAQAGPAGRR